MPAKDSTKPTTRTTRAATTSAAPTGAAATDSTVASTSTPAPVDPPTAEPLPERGVAVNSAFVAEAVRHRQRSMSVQELQLALADADLQLGDDVFGLAGHQTYAAIQDFQRSRGLEASGIPDAETLRLLGFTVVG